MRTTNILKNHVPLEALCIENRTSTSMTDLSNFSDNSYMDRNPDSSNLKWYHHTKLWKEFCYEEKIRRQDLA